MRRQWILIGQSFLKTIRIEDQIIPSKGEENRTRHRGKGNPLRVFQEFNLLVINKPACAVKILNLLSQRNSTSK